MKYIKLSQSELDTMLILWECHEPIRASSLLRMVNQKTSWSISTLQTILSRLEEKGVVSAHLHGRIRYFFPAITKEEYAARETGSLMESLQDCSPVTLMAGLIRSGRLQEDDLDEIARLLQQARDDLQKDKR